MAKAKTQVDPKEKIKNAYIDYVLENGHAPASIFKFVKELKLSEDVFYDHFNSFGNIERTIWKDLFDDTVKTIQDEEVWDDYSVREKMLAFYFTLVEKMKATRSFILQTIPKTNKPDMNPDHLNLVKDGFKEFVNELLLEARETEEVTDRPVIGKRYGDGLWLQFLFVVGFWIKDDSIAFEKTDAAIEKAVNLSFDLMSKGPLDAMLDFGKFLYQNR